MERGLDLGCLIALRCESARRQSRSKIFKVKKLSTFFKTGFLHASGLLNDFKRKFFFRPSGQFLGTVCWDRTSVGQDVVGQEVSGAGCRGAELRGAGRHWGNILGAERRGAERRGAGAVVSGAGRRGAGRHWGNIPGAERRGAEG